MKTCFSVILLFSIVGTGYVQVRSQEQNSIVHDGDYMGLNRCLSGSHHDHLLASHRSELNAARISRAKISGSSHAAKWPPFSASLK